MTKIRTAEEVLTSDRELGYIFEELPEMLRNHIIYSMQEYAKQFIDLAAKVPNSSNGNVVSSYKESILKLKEMVK